MDVPIRGDLITVEGVRTPIRVAAVDWGLDNQVVITSTKGAVIYTTVELVHRVIKAVATTRRTTCWPSWRNSQESSQ